MSPNEAVANTKSGKLEGYVNNGLYVFKGVPYAAPPVGKLRWMPPQKPLKWSGVRLAKEWAAIAPQNSMPNMGGDAIVPSFDMFTQSEDCLFLNIWTPGLDGARRPVFFWIHGGAFIIGAGTEGYLDEGVLSRRGNIVVVSINYRLGALGFMNLKEVTGGKIPATGNEGMLDQIAALDWVHDNIKAFGGDPDNITISGFSAGGMSVGTLMGMPKARGKFHKAGNRSGAANVVSPLDDCVKISERYLKIFNLTGKDVDAMRSLTVKQLLDGQQQLNIKLREEQYRATPFQPCIDGKDLPTAPIEAIKKGSAKGVPTMAGTSLDEMKMMAVMDPNARNLDRDGMVKRLGGMMPAELVPGMIKAYEEALTKRGVGITPAEIVGSVNTDLMFRIATIRLVEAQRDNNTPAYNYLFIYRSPAMGGIMGAMHGLDSPFLFGALEPRFTGKDAELEALATTMQDCTIAFVKTGDPSCKSIEWPVYGKDRMTMLWDRKPRVEAAPYEQERAAWDRFDYQFNPPM